MWSETLKPVATVESNMKPVEPKDLPMKRCTDGHEFNPYKYRECPVCGGKND